MAKRDTYTVELDGPRRRRVVRCWQLVWTCADKTRVRVGDMTDFHLDNVIAVLTRVCAQRPYTQEVYAGDDWWQEQEIDPSQQDCNGLTYAEWLDVMSMERKRRQDRDTLSKGG